MAVRWLMAGCETNHAVLNIPHQTAWPGGHRLHLKTPRQVLFKKLAKCAEASPRQMDCDFWPTPGHQEPGLDVNQEPGPAEIATGILYQRVSWPDYRGVTLSDARDYSSVALCAAH